MDFRRGDELRPRTRCTQRRQASGEPIRVHGGDEWSSRSNRNGESGFELIETREHLDLEAPRCNKETCQDQDEIAGQADGNTETRRGEEGWHREDTQQDSEEGRTEGRASCEAAGDQAGLSPRVAGRNSTDLPVVAVHPSSPPTRRALGVVMGLVLAGPTCPVERAGHPCPPRPVVADVEARAGERVVASSHSVIDGTYRLELADGTYTVIAVAKSLLPRCTPRNVTIVSGRPISADITCVTGIR